MIIVGDAHVEKKSLDELEKIFEEIIQQEDNSLVHLGDLSHKNRPTPKETYFMAKWVKRWVEKYKKVILISGNHDDLDQDTSAIDFLEHLGAEVHRTQWVSDKDLFGHFFVDKSPWASETAPVLADLTAKHRYVILGHYHDFYQLSENACHLGSIRYVSFNETHDQKYIGQITDRFRLIPLTTPVPLRTVSDWDDLMTIEPDTKVRLVINSFDDFKKIVSDLDKWKRYFYRFQVKLDFKPEVRTVELDKVTSLPQIINRWLDEVEDDEVREELQEQFELAKLI